MTHHAIHPDHVRTDPDDRDEPGRGLALLRVLAAARRPLRPAEVAAATGASPSDVTTRLEELRRGGLVRRVGEGYLAGWIVHGTGPHGQASVEHHELALDGGFMAFLSERLTEEVVAAHQRRAAGAALAPMSRAGLELVHEVMVDLERGVLPDDVSLELLVSAYAEHPDFRPEWRCPRTLLAPARLGTPRR